MGQIILDDKGSYKYNWSLIRSIFADIDVMFAELYISLGGGVPIQLTRMSSYRFSWKLVKQAFTDINAMFTELYALVGTGSQIILDDGGSYKFSWSLMRKNIADINAMFTEVYSGSSWTPQFKSLFTGIPVPYEANPILSEDWPFRDIVLVNGIYHLYEEGQIGAIWQIRKRTSVDGLAFTDPTAKLFSEGGAGTYDELGQADPTVVYDGVGDWKMWVDAKDGANYWSLGLATSADGSTWTLQGKVIDHGGVGTWDGGSAHHPKCVKYNGVYYVFYSGAPTGNVYGVQNLGLATSIDGINFTKEPTNPIISIGTAGQFDDTYLRPSRPIKIYNTWYMWYWGFNGTIHSMGLATSLDLIHWTKKGQVLINGVGVTASDAMLSEGTNWKDKIVKLWYVMTGTQQLYYTKVTLPLTGTKLSLFREYEKQIYGDNITNGVSEGYAANYIYFHRITSGALTPKSIKVYLSSANKPPSGKIKIALYSNNTATPQNLLAETVERYWASIKGDEWETFNFITPPVLSAGDYWIGILSTDPYNKNKGVGGANNWGNLSNAYGAFPNPVTAPTTQAYSDTDVYLYSSLINVYEVACADEPNNVYFNTAKGNKKTVDTDVDSEYDWFWSGGILKIYSAELPDVRYQITYD